MFQINDFIISQATCDEGKHLYTLEELALGFVNVANEAMSRPIRSLTQGKGFDTSQHILAVFGGAGSQHACSIAKNLGISTIFIHKYFILLSLFSQILFVVILFIFAFLLIIFYLKIIEILQVSFKICITISFEIRNFFVFS